MKSSKLLVQHLPTAMLSGLCDQSVCLQSDQNTTLNVASACSGPFSCSLSIVGEEQHHLSGTCRNDFNKKAQLLDIQIANSCLLN